MTTYQLIDQEVYDWADPKSKFHIHLKQFLENEAADRSDRRIVVRSPRGSTVTTWEVRR